MRHTVAAAALYACFAVMLRAFAALLMLTLCCRYDMRQSALLLPRRAATLPPYTPRVYADMPACAPLDAVDANIVAISAMPWPMPDAAKIRCCFFSLFTLMRRRADICRHVSRVAGTGTLIFSIRHCFDACASFTLLRLMIHADAAAAITRYDTLRLRQLYAMLMLLRAMSRYHIITRYSPSPMPDAIFACYAFADAADNMITFFDA